MDKGASPEVRSVGEDSLQIEEFQRALNAAQTGMCLIDADLRYVWVNEAFAALLRYEPDELRGMSVLEVTHPDDVDLHADLAVQVYNGELTHFSFRKRFFSSDGEIVSCDVLGTAAFDSDGQPLMGIGIQTLAQNADPTAKRIEALQRSAVVGQFTAAAVHDIRNSLSALSIVADTIETSTDLGESARLLRTELDTAHHLLRSISTFGSPTTQRAETADGPVMWSIGSLIDQVRTLLQLIVPDSIHLKIVVNDATLFPNIEPREFQQVLLNLVLNARDAIADNDGEIKITAERCEKARDVIKICVADTGTGMSPDDLSKAFTPYFTTKGEAGTGLGLSICREIVERQGGRLLVESAPSQGSRFTIKLPTIALDGTEEPER